jgi:hypothetical protein
MITLKCYEPAGRVLEFTCNDLTRHVIAFGATGSGKTTALINPVLRQVLAWRAQDRDLRPGLLVLDPKGDDSAEKVQAFAREAGRESDVVLLSPRSNSWLDLLRGFDRLEQVEAYARRLLSGTRDLGRDNAYWTETRDGLVQTALVLLLANGRPVRIAEAISFMQAWWFSPDPTAVTPKLDFVRQLLGAGELRPSSHRQLEFALAEAKHWTNLDPKTKELHRSTLHNALRPLLSSAAQSLFAPKLVEFQAQSVLDGKILVVSLDAITNPELAKLIFRIVRQDFYAAVQARRVGNPESSRLCGVIADELALSVMPEDIPSLSVIRSKGGFVVAATQSLNGLDRVLGWHEREALMANFNTMFFFAARESSLDEYAMLALGNRELLRGRSEHEDQNDILMNHQTEPVRREPICAPGTLARLGQHQALAKFADGTCTEWPVWLAPDFFNGRPFPTGPADDDLQPAITKLLNQKPPKANADFNAPRFLLHMHRRRHALRTAALVVAAVWPLCIPRVSRNDLRSNFGRHIAGMDAIPSCWLAGLHRWFMRNPKLADLVTGVAVKAGVLWPELDLASTMWGDAAVTIPESINLFIYPSLWRPLLMRHEILLRVERPDLGAELDAFVECKSVG